MAAKNLLPILRIWTLGILCILMTLIFVGYNSVVQKQIMLGKTQADLEHQANCLAMDIDRTLFGLSRILSGVENYLEAFPEKVVSHPSKVERTLKTLVRENPFLSSLIVLNATGQVVSWSDQGAAADFRQHEYFRAHTRKNIAGLFVGPPEPSMMKNGGWVFGVSRAIHAADGSLSRVLVAIVDLDYLHNHFSDLSPMSGSVLTLSSLDGSVYSRSPGYQLSVGRQTPWGRSKVAEGGTATAIRQKSPVDGKEYLVAARRVDKYPLVSMVSQREAKVLAAWRRDCVFLGGFGLVICLMTLLMTAQTARFQRKQANARDNLHQQAITDPLTAVFNRRHVVEQGQLEIKKALRSGAALSFVLLDLDHFKSVNDTYGHDTGDRVLIATADILKEICRETDIVSRFGGEEFLLVLPDTNLSGAMIMAEKIRKAMERKIHHYADQDFHVTASFGVSQWSVDEVDIREVLLRTDDALYEVKSNGRNQIKCAPAKSASSYVQELVSWRYDRL